METKQGYRKPGEENVGINPKTLRLFDDPEYVSPTQEDIKALKAMTGWNNNDIARMVGLHYSTAKGSTTVRKWLTYSEKEYRQIPYAAWRLLLLYARLVTI